MLAFQGWALTDRLYSYVSFLINSLCVAVGLLCILFFCLFVFLPHVVLLSWLRRWCIMGVALLLREQPYVILYREVSFIFFLLCFKMRFSWLVLYVWFGIFCVLFFSFYLVIGPPGGGSCTLCAMVVFFHIECCAIIFEPDLVCLCDGCGIEVCNQPPTSVPCLVGDCNVLFLFVCVCYSPFGNLILLLRF